MYIISKNTKIIKSGKKVLVSNIRTNKYFKVNRIYYEVVSNSIEKYGNIDVLKKNLYEEKILLNIQKLFEELCKIKVVVKNDEELGNEPLNKVIINCTNRCNLNCIHCCKNSSIYEKEILSTQDIKNIIDVLSNYNPEIIVFTGGEPLIRNDILKILKYAKSKCNGQITLNSNGTLINEDNVDELIKYVDVISISLDGIDEETTAMIRGKGVFNKSVQSIRLLQSKNFNKIFASMTITKSNEAIEKDFVKLCNEMNVKYILRKFEEIGRGEINKDFLMRETKSFALECEGKLSCKECKPGERELYIEYDGNMYPCQMLKDKQFCLGNIMKDYNAIDEFLIKKGNIMKKLLDEERPYNNKNCENCNVNIFCWSCLGEYRNVLQNKEMFKQICSYKHRKLEKIIW